MRCMSRRRLSYPMVEIPENVVERLLDTWPVARLATLGPGGPHQVPIVFARAGGAFWSPVDGKPKRGGELARLRHVDADPRVSLLIDRYADDWRTLWWIRIDGEAEVVRPASPAAEPAVAAALAALRQKYPQYEQVPLLGDPPTLLRIVARKLRSWGNPNDSESLRGGPPSGPL